MKKLLIVVSALMLVGAGCAKAPQKSAENKQGQPSAVPEVNQNAPVGERKEKQTRPPETNITTEEEKSLSETFTAKSEETGFKIYFPTFIPEGLKLDKNSASVSTTGENKVITYTLNNASSETPIPLVYIQQQVSGMELDTNIPVDQESEYLKGYIKTVDSDGISFYVLVFVKDDKTTIRISTRTDVMDQDTLSKVAESMK